MKTARLKNYCKVEERSFDRVAARQKNRTLKNEGCGTRKNKSSAGASPIAAPSPQSAKAAGALLPYCFAERGR